MRLVALIVLSVAAVAAQTRPAVQHGESPQERTRRMQWWREARFGMFIHWGISSVAAGEWNGNAIAGYAEWLMSTAGVPVAEYARLAERFDPVRFDAGEWVRLAKQAGMKYIVITAKHHDGFAMYDSKVSPFNIVAATPFHRDPLRELASACAREGMKLGFYYSQSQDWHHRGGAGNSWDPSQSGDYDAYLDSIAVPQVKELLTGYGPVAVLWYDTPRHMTVARADKFLALHGLQPGLIVNNRLRPPEPDGPNPLGDTETPEQFVPPNGYPGKDWETCMTMNDSWGFKRRDQNWKSADDLIRNLSDISSKGGNFLLNVGPTAEGEIPGASVERLRDIGAWLKRNGEAIYGTEAGPFAHRLPWGRASQKKSPNGGATLYLHVWTRPPDGAILLPGLHDRPHGVRMLTGSAAVQTSDTAAGLRVSLPAFTTAEPVTIAVLEYSKAPEVKQTLSSVRPDGRIPLDPSDAELSGPDNERPTISGSGDAVTISVRSRWRLQYSFTAPAERIWVVSAELAPSSYNRLTASAPGPFGASVTRAVQAWGDGPNSFTTVELGILRLPAGLNALELKSELEDPRPLRIRRIWLSPVK